MNITKHLLLNLTLALAFLLIAGLPVRAEEKVENPSYSSWNKFKPKTAAKYLTTTKVVVMGNEMVTLTDLTMTLVEVTADKVVVEYESVTKLMGMEIKAPVSRQEFPRLIALKPGQKKENVGKPDNVFEEGA